MEYLVYVGLALSLGLNGYLALKFFKKEHVVNVDAKRLLAEIMNGKAVVEIKLLDTSNMFFRSPRG